MIPAATMPAMKRIKALIKAFATTRQDPVSEIAGTIARLRSCLISSTPIDPVDVARFDDIAADIIELAKKPAKAESEAQSNG
jgi:hypothetical protein